MNAHEIRSVGWLNNDDGSIALSICTMFGSGHPVFVKITKEEFQSAGGGHAIKDPEKKQIAADFYNRLGAFVR